jgi:arylsulfatase A-like enzyme
MRRSLVLITVDCLRADHVGFLGYKRNNTPFLDSLAPSSLVFSNAAVAGVPTYYSFPAIMASRSPLALGRDVIGLSPEEVTIASALHQSGYSTAVFLAGNPYLSPRFGYESGFDSFHDFLEQSQTASSETTSDSSPSWRTGINRALAKSSHNLGLGRLYDELYFQYCQAANRSVKSFDQMRRFPSADVLVDRAIAWLEGVSYSPFFLWLHLMDPHSPYYPKAEALTCLGIEIDAERASYLNSYWNRGDIGANRLLRHRDEIIGLYDAGIRWVDSQLGRLVEKLRERGHWNDLVFAVTADHGEEFLEHGGRYHSPAKLTEELTRVPVLIHRSNSAGEIRSEPFSLIDLAPTLFEAIDVPASDTFSGNSRYKRENCSNEPVVVESVAKCTNPFDLGKRATHRLLAVRDSVHKLVIDFETTKENLFNLKTDPGELHPLPREAEKAVRRRLLECAGAHIAKSIRSQSNEQRLDAQLRELRLECEKPVNAVCA